MLSKNQIKEIQSLQLKKTREARQLFLAEGVKTVLEMVQYRPELLKELFFTELFFSAHESLFKSITLPYTLVSDTELKKISLQSNPNQVLAVCYQPKSEGKNVAVDSNFYFFLDDIRDPGNLGTIIRIADWFGSTTVFCSPDCCEFFNPKVIQSSMGAFLRVEVIYTELQELIDSYRIKKVYGAVLNGKNIYKENLNPGLIVIGNEANGIAEKNLPHITQGLTIPAKNTNSNFHGESLNAAMATSIIASEFFRQLNAV